MTTDELLAAIRDALASDTALDTWCRAQFAKPATIFIGIDEKNPPAESDYPLVSLTGVTHDRGDYTQEISWDVFLGIGVVNETITTSGNKQTAEGLLQAEAMRELAENAIFRARIASTKSSGLSSTESYYPLYVSYTALTMSVLKSSRRALP
ncbi:MAG: hypothetical protein WC372_08825 [Candidatus Neomarinimicrobiota bacterium]|jgi:hypothetical protein